MLRLIIITFYFIFPAYIANMTPVIIQRLGFFLSLNRPIDGGYKLFGDYIFGTGKTWRGLIWGVLMAILTAGLQSLLYASGWVVSFSLVDFFEINFIFFGFLAGTGALLGDLIKSFIKRRVGIRSGGSWPVFDQLDYILGFFAAVSLVIPWRLDVFLIGITMTLILTPLMNIIGYYLKIKKVWW